MNVASGCHVLFLLLIVASSQKAKGFLLMRSYLRPNNMRLSLQYEAIPYGSWRSWMRLSLHHHPKLVPRAIQGHFLGAPRVLQAIEQLGSSQRGETAICTAFPGHDLYNHGDEETVCSGSPTLVVSLGFTREEAAEVEVAFRSDEAAYLFPSGVRVFAGMGESSDVNVGGEAPTLRQVVLGQPRVGRSSAATVENSQGCRLPKLLLVLSTATTTSPDDDDDEDEENSPLLLPMMEVLDAHEGVPPAVLRFPRPAFSASEEGRDWGDQRNGEISAKRQGEAIERLVRTFDPALLDTALPELWRKEARRHANCELDQYMIKGDNVLTQHQQQQQPQPQQRFFAHPNAKPSFNIIRVNGLAMPVKVHDTNWKPSEQNVKVAMNLELDGAWVESAMSPGGKRWDASKVVVIDGIVDEDLRRELLDLVTEADWDKSSGFPPTSKWERGLSDVDCEEEAEEEEDGDDETGHWVGGGGRTGGSWGLTEEAMAWLCQEGEHPALVEVQSRLQKVYPDVCICHMPEAVLGASTPRMVANAPVYGDRFSWHVDADPASLPPSPWRDHFGTYTNRESAMPLFATLLVYLDAEWAREWDAETLFLDPPSGTGVFVRPRGGRVLMMDQDVTHRISTPSQIAGRPRYSLVWKLVFLPKTGHLAEINPNHHHDAQQTNKSARSKINKGDGDSTRNFRNRILDTDEDRDGGAHTRSCPDEDEDEGEGSDDDDDDSDTKQASLNRPTRTPSIALGEWGEPVRFGSSASASCSSSSSSSSSGSSSHGISMTLVPGSFSRGGGAGEVGSAFGAFDGRECDSDGSIKGGISHEYDGGREKDGDREEKEDHDRIVLVDGLERVLEKDTSVAVEAAAVTTVAAAARKDEEQGVDYVLWEGRQDGKDKDEKGSGALSPSSSAPSSSAPSSSAPSSSMPLSVEIRPVGAKGNGVFATRPIAEGEVIGFYTGEVLSREELDTRYPDFEGSEYVMQIGPDTYLDAKDPDKSGFTRYVNHSSRSPNLVVELRPIAVGNTESAAAGAGEAARLGLPGDAGSHGVALTASRDVARGEEVTFDYGEGYFEDEDDEGNVIEDGQEMVDMLSRVDWGAGGFSM